MTNDAVEIVGPQAVGLDPAKVAALVERAHREVDAGLLPSCQLAIARHGQVAAFETIGDVAPASRYVMYSATKAFVASGFWLLLQDGRIGLDAKVADLIPEFASNGKEVVTVEQVLLHTSGFPYAPLGPPRWDTRDGRLEAFARWRLNWEPGTRYEYHATTAHWVLAELIERVDGRDYRAFLREEILDPLDLHEVEIGVSPERLGDINRPISVGEPATPDELEAVLGVRDLGRMVISKKELLQFNRDDVLEVGVPGGGGVSNAADVVRFYQALLHGGPWNADTVRQFTVEVRNRFTDLRGIPANRSLGLVIQGDDEWVGARGFGRTCSARTFGHDGAGGQIAFADPDSGISFCYLTNGLDEHLLREWRRTAAIANRAAVCLAA
jgi:CubicO group peptidase (beta-lactamase class C family)